MKLEEPTSASSNEDRDLPIASAVRALPAGARLDEFEIEGIISEGNVAIVYAATDRALEAPVAIAEYMPAGLARRHGEAKVMPRTSAQADAFEKGLKAFIKETRTLARCDHPSLVRIVRLCEVNSTAYRVMPRYPCRRLLDVRQSMSEPPDEEALRALLDALLGALAAYHHAGGCHGKVTPSNILILADSRPLLLAPGAAARAIASDRNDALTTAVEPCFAPIEQMVEPDIHLHPSADLYALAGVARYWMSGEMPAPVFGAPTNARREKLADTVQRMCQTWPQLHYSAPLLDALDNALSIYPAERPQSVAQMRARLDAAPPSAGALSNSAWLAAPVLNEVVPSSPAPASQAAPPARVTQALDASRELAPEPEPVATCDVAPIDDDPSVRTAFAHQAPNRRRIAIWGSAALALLALLIGIAEFGPERPVGRVLGLFGSGRGTDAGAPVSALGAGRAAPLTPPIAADAGAATSVLTEATAGDAPSRDTAPRSLTNADDVSPTAATIAAPPAVVQPSGPIRPPLRVAQQHLSRAPASPREVCGARTHFSLYRCMQTQCSRPQWASHAQCERLRLTDNAE